MSMALRELKTEDENWECVLCNRKTIDEVSYGPLIEKDGIAVHYFCLLFSKIEQTGGDQDGIYGFLISDIMANLVIADEKKCCFCSGKRASTECAKANCSAIFHYPCGLENGSRSQFSGRFNSYCKLHKPQQRVPKPILKEIQENPPTCSICLELVDLDVINDSIYANCCRTTWYHRDCLQRLAFSSGTRLKCVTCRESIKFRALLRRYGIYIPRRDASWETIPGAYEDLYARHNQCDATDCTCPYGITHVDENWKLLLCKSCGSKGVHVNCSDRVGAKWECDICRNV